MGTVERIYGHFELPINNAASEALGAHIAANKKGRHGKHEYKLEDWGLSQQDVLARFAPYIERFGIEMD
jgi:hypothetical protein